LSKQPLIIGAGPAGLTAAYELSKLGCRSTILEADRQVGGLSRTVNYRNFRFDIGGHRFFSKVPVVHEYWNEILGGDFLSRSRHSRIHYKNRFFDYPLKAGNALKGLGLVEALRVLSSYTTAKLFPSAEESNFEQWVANRFGYRLYEIFFKAYTEKVWGMPCSDISADWAVQRIRSLTLSHALLNALLGRGQTAQDGIVTSLINTFHYPRLGPGMMWERCAQLLSNHGIATLCGFKVEKIHHRHNRVEHVTARTDSGDCLEFNGSDGISTMPLNKLVQSLDPPLPADVIDAARRLVYRDYLTVVLIVKREHVFPDQWIYIHTPDVKVARIQNYKNWSSEMVPDQSRTSLGLEYFLSTSDPIWRWSQDQLIDLAVRESVQLGIVLPGEIEDGTVVRMKGAYPVYDANYRGHVERIRRYLAKFLNLQTVGRNGLHRYNNQDHSMLTAIYAARNILGDNQDVWSVNTDLVYHEEDLAGKSREDRMVPVPLRPKPLEG